MSEASDWIVQQDLAMMIRRLCRRLERDMKNGYVDRTNKVIVGQACELLLKYGLQGTPLRRAVRAADAK
jgi:hypothetical protein